MEKKVFLKEEVGEWSSFETDIHSDVNEVLEWVRDAIEDGATHIKWSVGEGTYYVYGQPMRIKLESDEEFNERCRVLAEKEKAELEARIKWNDMREKSEYERLKKKFEGKQTSAAAQ
jgi:hypothetical protein